jgi:tRNA(Ile)-lysidine synthase
MIPRDTDPSGDLPDRLARHLRTTGLLPDGSKVLVAVSGGLDSTVLLHLLRFGVPEGILGVDSLVAIHVDHRMRAESPSDALWVGGVCRAWGIPFECEVLDPPPTTEASAREARYAVLEGVRRRTGCAVVATAHHADDQAETVLFRALRGSGPRGLRGILERRAPALVRPLLPFPRDELVAYADRARLPVRVDRSNQDPRWTRNRVRHELLPLAEELVPGATAALARLAGVMAEREEAWEEVLDRAGEGVLLGRSAGRIEVARTPFVAYHSAVRAGLLERWIREFGQSAGGASIRCALDLVSSSPSGRQISLPGGVILARAFDQLVLSRPEWSGDDEPLAIVSGQPGEGVACVGGRRSRVRWGETAFDTPLMERFVTSGLRFPLHVRGWQPGDRIRLPGGTRKLKKVLSEGRIPAGERKRLLLIVDAGGVVLWIPGVVRSTDAAGAGAGFFIGVVDAERS